MILTITTTHQPATDLGFLLRKNPNRCQSFELSFGKAHVFYPEANQDRCTAALLLDIDPIGLVRSRGPSGDGFNLKQYVNDRPYVASSFLSVAISQVFGSALSGKNSTHTELAAQKIPLEAGISVIPCRGGDRFLRNLFEPLGYEVEAIRHPLDETFPEWGESSYFSVTLRKTSTLQEFLTHLYVLIPVLDNDKHYWVGTDEVEKLLRHGAGWLEDHPEKEAITLRYLKHFTSLAKEALARLTIEEEGVDSDEENEANRSDEEALESKISLHETRLDAVLEVLKQSGAKKVLDLGCGEGKLLRRLLHAKQFEEIVGLDVSIQSLEHASERIRFDRLRPKDQARIKLIHGSLLYRDKRLAGFDAAALVEVIEHLDEPRLSAFERVLFEFARPTVAVITTPNREYNVKFEDLPAGKFRHKDHRFEWTRAEFSNWAQSICNRFGYTVELLPVGEEDSILGAPSQMGIFRI